MPSPLIEIFKEDERVDVREGKNAKGNDYRLCTQVVYVHLEGKFPVKSKVPIHDGEIHYPAGKYELSLSSFAVGDFDALTISRDVRLAPAVKAF